MYGKIYLQKFYIVNNKSVVGAKDKMIESFTRTTKPYTYILELNQIIGVKM